MLRIFEVEFGARRAGFTSVDLAQVVIDAVELYEPMAEEKGIILHAEASAAAMPGDPSLLFEAVGNWWTMRSSLLRRVVFSTARTFAEGGRTGVEVIDTGPGIPRGGARIGIQRFTAPKRAAIRPERTRPGTRCCRRTAARHGAGHHRRDARLPRRLSPAPVRQILPLRCRTRRLPRASRPRRLVTLPMQERTTMIEWTIAIPGVPDGLGGMG